MVKFNFYGKKRNVLKVYTQLKNKTSNDKKWGKENA